MLGTIITVRNIGFIMALPTSGKLITVNDRGARAATTFGSCVQLVGGNMVFIKKLTASSSSSTLSFVKWKR